MTPLDKVLEVRKQMKMKKIDFNSLSLDEQRRYIKFFLKNSVQFNMMEDGQLIANIQILPKQSKVSHLTASQLILSRTKATQVSE